MILKNYQKATLGTLNNFFLQARIYGLKQAYESLTQEPEQFKRLKGYAGVYTPLNGLEQTPYVCLRLPTGGGKTILGAYAVEIAANSWMEKDFPMVLWLVPTQTIRSQTVEALKDPKHPYRKVLDERFGGRVRVFDIGDFETILPHDLRSNCCVVVGTIQSLRVKNTEGRKVYSHHEMLEPHFTHVSERKAGLETISEGGTIKFSFANLMHLHRPLMIVDEAHKAVTGLSEEMQARVNPSAIIEFTATPRKKSNILHSVTAQELKDEEMIKLPVMLTEHPTWQQAVTTAISKRSELEEIADKDKDYIRPIVLFQAQNKNQEVNVAALRQHLIDNEGIEANKIAVATGDQRELDGINLFDPDCEIEYVITVEALKEGWDCSFAYVFCSVANIHSATDAEQLLGRVLRMPFATKRKSPALNKSYAALVSKSFSETAKALRDKLVAMGFEEEEAEANIEAEQLPLNTGLFGSSSRPKPQKKVTVKATPEKAKRIRSVAPTKIKTVEKEGGGTSIEVTGFLTPKEKEQVKEALETVIEVREFEQAMFEHEEEHGHLAAPAERGMEFTVPRLMANIQGELDWADTDILMEYHDWSLSDHSPKLSEKEFGLKSQAHGFEIDLGYNQKINWTYMDQTEQMMLDIDVEDWTNQTLVLWLDRKVRDKFISQPQLVAWLSDGIRHLTEVRDLPLNSLMQCKYILAKVFKDRIEDIRRKVREGVYQQSLFGPEAAPEISFETGFTFKEGVFEGCVKYRGSGAQFRKHFTGTDNIPAFDGKVDGEEFQCAVMLDSLPDVKHWIRNVAKHPEAFYLPLADGKFYPDYVAELNDGRIFVVEYKGGLTADTGDTERKRSVGAKWEQVSNGKGLFLIVEKEHDGRGMREQMLAKTT